MKNKKLVALILTAAVVTSNISTGVMAETVNDSNISVLETREIGNYTSLFGYSNLSIVNGSENGNISSELSKVTELESGTVVMRFDNKGGAAFQTLLSFSKNTEDNERFYLYINTDNRYWR